MTSVNHVRMHALGGIIVPPLLEKFTFRSLSNAAYFEKLLLYYLKEAEFSVMRSQCTFRWQNEN
jgi:hypothetical protein